MYYVLVSSGGYSEHLHEAGQIDSSQVVRVVEMLESWGKDEEKPVEAAIGLCNATTPKVEQRLKGTSTRVFHCQQSILHQVLFHLQTTKKPSIIIKTMAEESMHACVQTHRPSTFTANSRRPVQQPAAF